MTSDIRLHIWLSDHVHERQMQTFHIRLIFIEEKYDYKLYGRAE